MATNGRKQMKRCESLALNGETTVGRLTDFCTRYTGLEKHRVRDRNQLDYRPVTYREKISCNFDAGFFLLSDKRNYFEELSKKLENKVKKGKRNYADLVRMERKN